MALGPAIRCGGSTGPETPGCMRGTSPARLRGGQWGHARWQGGQYWRDMWLVGQWGGNRWRGRVGFNSLLLHQDYQVACHRSLLLHACNHPPPKPSQSRGQLDAPCM